MPNSHHRLGLALVLALLLTPAALAAPEKNNPPSLPTVDKQMEKFVESKEIAGAVTIVATPDKIVHLGTAGMADVAGGKPMRPDSILWIASMSKPICGTAIMMLVDEGKLSIDDPVEKYLPEFKELKTKDGAPANLTIKHLLTHTSGMGEITTEQAKAAKTLADVIPLYVKMPVSFTPGSKWNYCQSGINTAGRIVEVVSGQSYPEFLSKRLFQPLGMKDTTFYLSEEQLPRLAKSYQRTKDGQLEPTEVSILMGKPATSTDRFPMANGGLFSTAGDYARFLQMVLNGGQWEGHRYLKPETVKQMTSLQTGDIKTGFTPGCGWGIGWCVVPEPQGVSAALSPGSFGHGGAYGTQAWIDPVKKRAYVLMVQRANFPNSDASDVRKAFQDSAAAALDK